VINLYSHFAMGFAPDVTVSGSAAVWLTGPAVPVILIVDAPGEAVGEAVRDKVVVPFGPDVIFDVTPAGWPEIAKETLPVPLSIVALKETEPLLPGATLRVLGETVRSKSICGGAFPKLMSRIGWISRLLRARPV